MGKYVISYPHDKTLDLMVVTQGGYLAAKGKLDGNQVNMSKTRGKRYGKVEILNWRGGHFCRDHPPSGPPTFLVVPPHPVPQPPPPPTGGPVTRRRRCGSKGTSSRRDPLVYLGSPPRGSGRRFPDCPRDRSNARELAPRPGSCVQVTPPVRLPVRRRRSASSSTETPPLTRRVDLQRNQYPGRILYIHHGRQTVFLLGTCEFSPFFPLLYRLGFVFLSLDS